MLQQTASARAIVHRAATIQDVLRNGRNRKELYLDFLGQPIHHVSCTAPLMALAAARCGPEDHLYQSALFEYIEGRARTRIRILADIHALGGEPEQGRQQPRRLPLKVMVRALPIKSSIAFRPKGSWCMIHVLEGMAVAWLGSRSLLFGSLLAPHAKAGFKYLTDARRSRCPPLRILREPDQSNRINGHLPLVIETNG